MRLPRVRFTVITMMIAVAAVALPVDRLRPISERDAIKIAKIHFLQVPGASIWAEQGLDPPDVSGCYGKDYWVVTFRDSIDANSSIVRVSMDWKGNVLSTFVRLPGPKAWLPADGPKGWLPAESVTGLIPPPKRNR